MILSFEEQLKEYDIIQDLKQYIEKRKTIILTPEIERYAFDTACILYFKGLTIEKLETEYKDLPFEWIVEILK